MNRTFACCLIVLVAALATPSHAATISYFNIFGPTQVPFAAAPATTLGQFDPALGTLQKVTLKLDVETSAGSIAWDNEAPVATDLTLGIGAEVTATGPAGLSAIAVPLQTDSATNVDADNDGRADFLGTDSFTVIGGTGSDSGTGSLMFGLVPYIGLGSFAVTVGATPETFLSTTGGFGPIDPQLGVVAGTVTVTYEYITAGIPEPTAFTLLAVGLLAALTRRRAFR